MAVDGERIESGVAQHAEPGMRPFHRGDGAAHQILRIERLFASALLR